VDRGEHVKNQKGFFKTKKRRGQTPGAKKRVGGKNPKGSGHGGHTSRAQGPRGGPLRRAAGCRIGARGEVVGAGNVRGRWAASHLPAHQAGKRGAGPLGAKHLPPHLTGKGRGKGEGSPRSDNRGAAARCSQTTAGDSDSFKGGRARGTGRPTQGPGGPGG